VPDFEFTPDQLKALEALDWLYSEDHRRTGRTTVLAFNFLRRIVLESRFERHRPGDGWITVHDHYPSWESVEHMASVIMHMAARAGIDSGAIEVKRLGLSVQMRMRGDYVPTIEELCSLAELGEVTSIPTEHELEPDPEDTANLWDHLTDPQ